jgi:DNA-binding XRE family transcriptional regulator
MKNNNVYSDADVQCVTLAGQRFVIVPEPEYRRLRQTCLEGPLPEWPVADADGNYPAIETLRTMLARDLAEKRRALGLTQAELAQRAGVRPETVNRLELGKHSPSVRTVDKLDTALREVEAERNQRSSKRARRRGR